MIIEEILESLIDNQALLNPFSYALYRSSPDLYSSFALSKIKIFASTAIPIDKIKPATPASVIVIPHGVNVEILNIASETIE